jgi:hypothetical protein
MKLFFRGPNFVPFLYRRSGKVGFLALLALREFNNLGGINQVNSSTPVASTTISFIIKLRTHVIFIQWLLWGGLRRTLLTVSFPMHFSAPIHN